MKAHSPHDESSVRPAKITVVSPVFNEADTLPEFCRRLRAVMDGRDESEEFEVILVDDGSRDRTPEILREEGMKTVVLDPQRHDELMGLVQGVNHLSTLALADCISRSGFGREELINGSTQTFEQRLDRISSMFRQSATLFGSLLMNNPAAEGPMDSYLQSVKRLMRVVQSGDQQAFEDLYDSLKEYFGVK